MFCADVKLNDWTFCNYSKGVVFFLNSKTLPQMCGPVTSNVPYMSFKCTVHILQMYRITLHWIYPNIACKTYIPKPPTFVPPPPHPYYNQPGLSSLLCSYIFLYAYCTRRIGMPTSLKGVIRKVLVRGEVG